MENIRNDLLRKNSIDAYCKMITFFEDPIRTNIDDVIESLDEELQNKLDSLKSFNNVDKTLQQNNMLQRAGQVIETQEVTVDSNLASKQTSNKKIFNYAIGF